MVLKIKEVLEAKGVSVIELAEKLGVTRGACYNYINGNPTVEILNRIAEAIDVPITELFVHDKKDKDEEHNIEFYVSVDGDMKKINKTQIVDFFNHIGKQ